MKVFSFLEDVLKRRGAGYLVLIDPDKMHGERLVEFVTLAEEKGADAFLVGGSLLVKGDIEDTIKTIKMNTKLPAILFPGGIEQLSPAVDAVLYISLISGRNPEALFGKHVLAAPTIKKYGLEAISCGYMLIESGGETTAEYISGTKPIPRNKPEIAIATALAAEYMGMKTVYLEAGSGAEQSVPAAMVRAVANEISIPLIVGGGVKKPETAREMVKAGADFIVTGNFFEKESHWEFIADFAHAIHKY